MSNSTDDKILDVKLMRISTAEAIIAEVLSETDDSIAVQNGLVVIPQLQGVGFAPWATVISNEELEITVNKKFTLFTLLMQFKNRCM